MQTILYTGSLVAIEELQFGKIIGRGSFGEVHKGTWNGMTVALKRIRLPPGTESSTMPTPQEVSLLKWAHNRSTPCQIQLKIKTLYSRELNHANIVSLLAHCVTNDEIVLVMNFINGSNLDRILFSKNLHDYKEVGIIIIIFWMPAYWVLQWPLILC